MLQNRLVHLLELSYLDHTRVKPWVEGQSFADAEVVEIDLVVLRIDLVVDHNLEGHVQEEDRVEEQILDLQILAEVEVDESLLVGMVVVADTLEVEDIDQVVHSPAEVAVADSQVVGCNSPTFR